MESENQKVISEAEELPRTIVRRVVKEKLCNDCDDMSVHKDALLAFSESARIFIHYLSATANDICKESKRQTINADDVLTALQEIEFSHFLGPLKASLHEFRQKNAGKKAGAAKEKEEKKKRKLEELSHDSGGGERVENEDNQDGTGHA
ncbi:DNA polymerase II subunit B4 [Quercus suber]|uniref:Dna polymerase epsilon subunit 3 n=1 Tax=Quercus suber TaxID=58331 RepID=A0AAW0LX89_QUESU|nr:DNA polymerase epsilon subunit 3 [Quercus suber]POF06659.1 dna polymerase epsilon subunit 3 [Quercus suber]